MGAKNAMIGAMKKAHITPGGFNHKAPARINPYSVLLGREVNEAADRILNRRNRPRP